MAKHMLQLACCVILPVLSGACSTAAELGQTMGSWQGSHIDDVTLAWGQPTTCDTIFDRRICSWHDRVGGISPSTAQACVRTVEVDPDGVVIGWRWRGDYCHATADRFMARAQFERPGALTAESLDAGNPDVAAIEPAE